MKICILKDQIIESSSLKGNKNSDKDEVNFITVKMYGTDQNIKNPNDGKENVKLLNSNYREEKSCEDLEEKNINSNLVTGLGETEIKVHKQLRSPVLLYMSLKDSDEKVNNKLGLSCAKLSRSWGFKMRVVFEVGS